MHYFIHRSRRSCARARAFTLLELLIVIGIITLLIVLGLSVAGKVTVRGKTAATEGTLKALDTALSEYIQASGANPPPFVTDPRANNTNGQYIQPVIDGRCGTTGSMVNSVGFFMLQCRSVHGAAEALKKLDSKIVREYSPDTVSAAWDVQPMLQTAFDGWGRPIRYVHPAFKGVIYGPNHANPTTPQATVLTSNVMGPPPPAKQYGITEIRRNKDNSSPTASPPDADSDGGLNPGTRPYFYSSGPDGDPSTIADNVYLTVPRVQKN